MNIACAEKKIPAGFHIVVLQSSVLRAAMQNWAKVGRLNIGVRRQPPEMTQRSGVVAVDQFLVDSLCLVSWVCANDYGCKTWQPEMTSPTCWGGRNETINVASATSRCAKVAATMWARESKSVAAYDMSPTAKASSCSDPSLLLNLLACCHLVLPIRRKCLEMSFEIVDG